MGLSACVLIAPRGPTLKIHIPRTHAYRQVGSDHSRKLILPTKEINLTEIEGKPIQLKASRQGTSKGVLLRYPILMPLTPIEKHPNMLEVKKCRIYTGEPTRQVEITVQGPLPGCLELGS